MEQRVKPLDIYPNGNNPFPHLGINFVDFENGAVKLSKIGVFGPSPGYAIFGDSITRI
jgi:hypothetical protein